MMYSVQADVSSHFSLFAMTRDLRAFLRCYYGVPDEAVQSVFLWRNRIDFTLKKGFFDEEWFLNLAGQES